jgi:uncharacterized protein YciI
LQREREVVTHLSDAVEERHAAHLERLERRAQRAKSACDALVQERQTKIDQARRRIADRLAKAKDEKEREIQTREELRQKVAQDDQAAQQRLREIQSRQSLLLAGRKFDRESRFDDLKHRQAAQEHLTKMRIQKEAEELMAAAGLEEETRKKLGRRSLESYRFDALRDQILAEFRAMADKLDDKALKRIQKIIGVGDDEMRQMIRLAEETAGPRKKPEKNGASDEDTPTPIVPPPAPEPKDAKQKRRK